jgi:hypothetical protein
MTTAKSNSETPSRLAAIQRGPLHEALRFFFYAPEGIGKSTLAAHSDAPIFIDAEDGTGRLDAARYPFREGPGGHVPYTYADILAAISDLTSSPHEFRTLVIDTMDRVEALLWAHVCEQYSGTRDDSFNKAGRKITSLESFGYGKGFQLALDEWRHFCTRLDRLRRERGMTIILLGHTVVRTFKNPTGEDFDRYQPRIHDKAAGFLKEWCDVVGFCAHEEGVKRLNDDDRKAKGISTGRRFIHLERTAAYDAKTRIPLPSSVELSLDDPWGPLAAAIDAGRNTSAADLIAQIGGELERIGDADLSAKVQHAIETNARGNTATLSRYLNDISKRPAIAAEESAA